ncbi:MAG: ComEC/Rec2 family competence protein [Patescibacteria group bacterium]
MPQTAFSCLRIAPSRQFLWGMICIVMGAALAPYLSAPVWLLVASAAVCLFLCFIIRQPGRLVFICLLGFILGWLRFQAAQPVFADDSVVKYSDQLVEVTGVITGEEDRRADHSKLTLAVDSVNDTAATGKLLVRAPLYPEAVYGDVIKVSCFIRRPEPIEDFQYDRYLALSGIYATCSTRYFEIRESGRGDLFHRFVFSFKRKLITRVNQLLPEPPASFLAGLLVGARKGIPDDLQTAFNRTGTTHIIAISGYNITIIATILLAIFKPVIGRKKAFWLIVIAIIWFVVLTGAQASVVRAGIMGILVLLARQLGRTSRITNALILAAVIMIIVNPLVLRDDKGFQLSFLATCGLVYLSPRIERFFTRVPAVLGLRESVTATLSATIATLPLIVITFGRLSLVAPFANLLILSVIPPTMGLGFIMVLTSYLWWPVGQVISWLVWGMLSYIISIVNWLAELSWSSVNIPSLPWGIVIVMFGLLGWLLLPAMQLFRPQRKGFRYD